MKTPPTQALKRFVERMHLQLPLDARESRRLVGVLNDTFKKQLDKQHPPPEYVSESRDKSQPRVDPISFHGSKAPNRPSSHLSTTEHLESILSNPLFIYGRSGSGLGESSHPAVRNFRALAAKGAADLAAAEACLRSVFRGIKPSNGNKELVAKTFAGSEIAAWLQSSGLIKSQEFRKDTTLLRALIGCLVAEGHYNVVADWLRLKVVANDDDSSGETTDVTWRRGIVSGLIHAVSVFRENLGLRMVVFMSCIKSHEMSVSQSGNTHEKDQSATMMRQIFQPVGNRLTRLLTMPHSDVKLSAKLFEHWMTGVAKWNDTPLKTKALLRIHHPTNPDASYALQYLKSLDRDALEQLSPEGCREHIQMCLDAAHLSLTQENVTASTWLINQAREILPGTNMKVERSESLAMRGKSEVLDGHTAGNLAFG